MLRRQKEFKEMQKGGQRSFAHCMFLPSGKHKTAKQWLDFPSIEECRLQ